ncbi:molybdopterin-binding/glycosyltransferase family 2 protein [Roseomonas gilardii subsp. gilardii]|uniref:NTP transferase domain-containing protein n=1 Tax=Roseomonas gilardii TaxID=257708 RepID=UPI001FFB03A6|nr:molybdopterin-binding/glycosyltransferase family 2 protein [Roseomonas gilardii]UPG71484.1 molybdopterin-binding/glycosyltransferase family 2 protein [Roseomonas gilardii subsp. gilardii]
MIFGPTPLEEALGAVLAHTHRLPGRVLKKGTVLDAAALAALAEAGEREVIAARLEPGDVAEDEAAGRLAEALLRPGLTRSRAATGRVNLFAAMPGVLALDVALIDRLNALDESLTLATQPAFAPLSAREMAATIKVIPFAVPGAVLVEAEALARAGHALSFHPYRPFRAGLAMSSLPGMKESILAGTLEATRARVEAVGGELLPAERVPHEEAAIAGALHRLRAAGADLLMVIGASAVVDRRDVGPAAITRAGGEIEHFGMPVDPGNLLCLGRLEGRPALVLPGCARSPALNGFDWVLQRLAAGIPVTGRDIQRLGAGGLLMEIETRPLPRAAAGRAEPLPRPGHRPVAALVLAAGLSRRMGPVNKLLAEDAAGRPMIARTVDHVLASRADPVIVVTGHERERVEAALAGRPVRFVHAPDHAEGLSASLRAGLEAVPEDSEGALVCLGDMPLVGPGTLDRILDGFDPAAGRSVVQPVHEGQPGNPVLWGREFFAEIRALTGDRGARGLLARHAAHLATVPVTEDSVLRDFDTPEALAGLDAPA